MKNFWLWLGVIIIVVVIAIALLTNKGSNNSTDNSNAQNQQITQPLTSDTPVTSEISTDNAIAISNFSFNPQQLIVKVGTTVTWTNNDSVAHQPVSDTGAVLTGISSPLLNLGDTYSFTFNQVGTWSYHCNIHQDMTGEVVVVE